MSKNAGTNRNIRLTDEQWQGFRELLGVKWLREQIAKAVKKNKSKPIAHKTEG